MLRKLFHISMVVLLLVSSSGIVIYKHYCLDELTGVSIIVDANHCHENSCSHCEDVTISCRLDVDLFSADAQTVPEKIQTEITVINLSLSSLLTLDIPVPYTLTSTRVTDYSSLHGIPMLQSFLC